MLSGCRTLKDVISRVGVPCREVKQEDARHRTVLEWCKKCCPSCVFFVALPPCLRLRKHGEEPPKEDEEEQVLTPPDRTACCKAGLLEGGPAVAFCSHFVLHSLLVCSARRRSAHSRNPFERRSAILAAQTIQRSSSEEDLEKAKSMKLGGPYPDELSMPRGKPPSRAQSRSHR